jgi:hypothetical protein
METFIVPAKDPSPSGECDSGMLLMTFPASTGRIVVMDAPAVGR